ncbi:MAG: hypothetical protein Kow0099_19480 [Candidatus Abyssubacteria bacterium]
MTDKRISARNTSPTIVPPKTMRETEARAAAVNASKEMKMAKITFGWNRISSGER